MAGAYIVQLPDSVILKAKTNVVVVYAHNSATAIDACKAQFGGDADALWALTTPVAIAETSDGLEGFRFHVMVVDPADQSIVYEATVTAANGDDVDDMGADMVVALEAEGGADLTPAYDSGTNVLTIAAEGDALGDMAVTAEILFPESWEGGSQALTGAVTTIVDEGVSGAALTCTLVALTVPTVAGTFFKIG